MTTRFFIILIVIQLTFRSSFAIFNCPTGFGLFPDPERCTNYYECENFTPTSKMCGQGLFFDPQQKICNWPDSVDQSACSGRKNPGEQVGSNNGLGQNPIPNSNQNSNHITFRCHADGLYEDPVSCNHFVECANGVPFRKICPANLVFDIRIKACNWAESMACSKHTKPLITARPTTNRPFITPSITTTEYTGSYATPPTYDENNQNRPSGHSQTPPTITSSTSASNCEWCFKCPDSKDAYYENAFDKLTYYHCVESQAYLMYCPRDTIYSQRRETCVAENALNDKNEGDRRNEAFKDEEGSDGSGLLDQRKKVNKNGATSRKPITTIGTRPTNKPSPTTRKPKK